MIPRESRALLHELAVDLEPTGLFEPARTDGRRLAVRLVAVAAFATAAFATGSLLLQLVAATLLGLTWAQLGFFGHDAVHGAAARSRAGNALVGQVCFSLVNGVGFQYWRRIHLAHHRHLQHDGRDPDVDFPNILSVTAASAAAKRGVWRRLLRYQAIYFWPLTLLYAHRLRVQGLARVVRAPRGHALDVVLVIAHYALWLALPLALGIDVWHVLAIYATSSAAMGVYLGLVFGVNHIGMRALAPTEQAEFVARHFDCTRNIANHPRADFLFGGLNFHAIHHLFPAVPHVRLRRARRQPVRSAPAAACRITSRRFAPRSSRSRVTWPRSRGGVVPRPPLRKTLRLRGMRGPR